MLVYVVTETHHMGIDGDHTNIVLVTASFDKAKEILEEIDSIPYEEYNWYSGEISSWEV